MHENVFCIRPRSFVWAWTQNSRLRIVTPPKFEGTDLSCLLDLASAFVCTCLRSPWKLWNHFIFEIMKFFQSCPLLVTLFSTIFFFEAVGNPCTLLAHFLLRELLIFHFLENFFVFSVFPFCYSGCSAVGPPGVSLSSSFLFYFSLLFPFLRLTCNHWLRCASLSVIQYGFQNQVQVSLVISMACGLFLVAFPPPLLFHDVL